MRSNLPIEILCKFIYSNMETFKMGIDDIVRKNQVDKIKCKQCDEIYDMACIGVQLDTNGIKMFNLYNCPSCYSSVAGNHTNYFVETYLKGDWSKLK